MLNSILKSIDSILNSATKWFLQAAQMLGPVWATPFVSAASTIGGMSWSHFFILHCKSCWNSFLSSLFNWSILFWSLHWQGHLCWYPWQIDRASKQAGSSGRQKSLGYLQTLIQCRACQRGWNRRKLGGCHADNPASSLVSCYHTHTLPVSHIWKHIPKHLVE